MNFPQLWESVEHADWLHLSEDETVRWTGRPSRYTIALAVGGGVLLALLGLVLTRWLRAMVAGSVVPGVFGFVPLLLTGFGIWLAISTYLDWLRLLYVVTDEQLYVKYGLVSRDVTQVRLDRVQNTSYNQTVVQRFLGYGDVNIYTAGTNTEDITFQKIPGPNELKRTLTDLLGEQADRDPRNRAEAV